MANTHALDLESGSSQYAATGNSPTNLNFGTSFTIEMWLNPETVSIGAMAVLAKMAGAGARSWNLQINRNTGGKLAYLYSTDGTNVGGISDNNTALSGSVWTHVALTYDGTTFTWYLNAGPDGTTNSSGINPFDSTARVIVGADDVGGSAGSFYDGKVDDVRIWSDARTQQEIEDNMNVELVGNEANLIFYSRLNNSYSDETSNNNDLTASGDPVFTTDVPFTGVFPGGNPIFFSGGGLGLA